VLKVSLQEEPQAKAKAPRFQVQAFSDDEQEDDAAAGTAAKPEDWVLKMERGLQKATLDENEDTSSDDEDVTMKKSTSSSQAQQNKDWKRSTGQKRKQPTADASSSDEDDAPGKENPWAVSMANNPRKILQRKNETETAKEVVKAGLKASKHIDKKAKREGRNQPTKLDMQKTLLRTVGSDNEAEADVDLLGGSKSNAQMIRDAFMSSTDKQEAEKFRLEKEAAIADKLAAEDHEQLRVKTAVAGWGSWGGLGVQPKKKSRRQRMKEAAQKKRVEKKRNAIIMRRKDARLENVIISERENKRQALKYHVPTVPYPFTSKQQFEAAQRHPLGSEWNTQDKYKAFIEPRIQVQHGALIEPAKFDKTQQMDLKKKRNARRKISAQAGKYEKK
jgi:U3 small nucleolar RNA-associated protein 14